MPERQNGEGDMELKDLKVLICDDSILIRKKLEQYFASHGCSQVEQAADGNQAVEKYKVMRPDLVLMDIVMPLKSGIDALKEIRQYDPKARVVMASSVGTQSHLKEAILAGAFDFLQKPIEEPQLEKLLENTLKVLNQK